jgi:hypothetical protein
MLKNDLKNIGEESYEILKDLDSIPMHRGQLYETIVTTQGPFHEKNAAPMGVLCKNYSQITLYLNEGSHTSINILNNQYFIVNITQDPLLFAISTLKDMEDEYYEDYKGMPYLKNTDAFFIAHTEDIKKVVREDKFGTNIIHVITARVDEIVRINKGALPLNRGIYSVIETLIHYSRFNLADCETKDKYWNRIKELNRVAQKVGSKKDKEAMYFIMKNLKENFKDLE